MARSNAASAFGAFLALQLGTGCSSEGGGTTTSTEGSGGGGGNGASQGAGAGSVASSSASGVGPGSTSSGTGGNVAADCDPPAEPGSIYEKAAETYDIEQSGPVAMCAYRGDVMLIVNIAAL